MTGNRVDTFVAVFDAFVTISDIRRSDGEEQTSIARAGSVIVGSGLGDTAGTVSSTAAFRATFFTGLTGIRGVGVVSVFADTNVFGEFNDSVFVGHTGDTKSEVLLARAAEGIGVAVTLDTGGASVSDGETWSADTGFVA